MKRTTPLPANMMVYGDAADCINQPDKIFAVTNGQTLLMPIEILEEIEEEQRDGSVYFGRESADVYRMATAESEEFDLEAHAAELADETVYTEREAQAVILLGWFDLNRHQAASILDISPNTVDNHRRAALDRLEKAKQTTEVHAPLNGNE